MQFHLVCSMMLIPREQEGKAWVRGLSLPHSGLKARPAALGKQGLHF